MTDSGQEHDDKIYLEKIRIILPEHYTEIRHRRDIVIKLITYYSAVCAVAVGWLVAAEHPLSGSGRLALGVILTIMGAIIVLHLGRLARSTASTARTIRKIAESLGLFKTLYPESWRAWGERSFIWPQWSITILGLATVVFLVTYTK